MSKPFFSIVIPTRNRAELLKYAVQSVLDQTFSDFEVIVSNNFSTDNTRETVAEFRDPRVRYVETPRSLEIGESFAFATDQATGEYVTYLSDDDACSIVTLETIAGAIENNPNQKVIVWSYCDYQLDAVNQYGYKSEPNSVWIPSFDGKVSLRNSKEAMKDLFAILKLTAEPPVEPSHKKYPGLINAAHHRSLYDEFRARRHNFFYPTGAIDARCAVNDLYSLIVLLYSVEDFLYVDYPLHLHGAWENSATTTLDGARRYYRASKEEFLVPFRCFTNKTFAANAFLLGKKEISEDLDSLGIDWVNFYRTVHFELMEMKKIGVDVDEDLTNFFEALEKTPLEFQTAVRLRLPTKFQMSKSKFIAETKNLLRPVYQKIGLSAIVNQARKDRDNANFLVKGSESGFDNILEFARKMDKNWLEEFRRKY